MMAQRQDKDADVPLDDEASERRLRTLVAKLRRLGRAARDGRRRHEAHLIVEADQGGRLTVRYRPEEYLEG